MNWNMLKVQNGRTPEDSGDENFQSLVSSVAQDVKEQKLSPSSRKQISLIQSIIKNPSNLQNITASEAAEDPRVEQPQCVNSRCVQSSVCSQFVYPHALLEIFHLGAIF